MFDLRGGPHQSYHVRYDEDTDFCVWTLLADGLQAPGFDAHPDGSGSLRAAGLTAVAWHAWIADRTDVDVRIFEAFDTMGSKSGQLTPGPEAIYNQWLQRDWDGAPLLKDRLALLREHYAVARQDIVTLGMEPHQREVSQRMRDAVWPYLDRTGTLTYYLANYPVPAYHLVRPRTVILGITGAFGDSEADIATMESAAAELADHADESA